MSLKGRDNSAGPVAIAAADRAIIAVIGQRFLEVPHRLAGIVSSIAGIVLHRFRSDPMANSSSR